MSNKAFIHTAIKGCLKGVYLTIWQVSDLQES